MGRTRIENTEHAYLRSAERCGWNKKKAKQMMKLASKYGKSFDHITNEKIREFVKARQVNTRRRIRYYCGYIFVFASTSTRCFTVYPYESEKENEDTNI